MTSRNYTVGADPELFLFSPEGKPLSIIGKLGGTKERPIMLDKKGFAYQEDNVAAEYNIPACKTASTFQAANLYMLDFLKKKLASFGVLRNVASVLMPPEELIDPRAMVFGCDPDFNAWSLKNNPPPMADDPTLRSAGGHIHVGNIHDWSKTKKIRLMRNLDYTVGLHSVIWDSDNRRRELYGQAGSGRFKPYGIEYRTPSNYWIGKFDKDIFNLVLFAVMMTENDEDLKYPAETVKVINCCDKELALSLFSVYDRHMEVKACA